VRQKAEELSREKSRLMGELDSMRKRLAEEEEKCKKDFNCDVKELPEIINKLKSEAESCLSKAECMLGLRDDIVIEENPKQESKDDEDGLL